jgi:uncharacterized membrane protein
MHILRLSVVAAAMLLVAQVASAQESSSVPDVRYYRAEVTGVLEESTDADPFVPELERFSQLLFVRFSEGPREGETVEIRYVPGSDGDADHDLRKGEKVIVVETDIMGDVTYYVADRDRFGAVVSLAIAFFALVVAFAGWKGLRSIAGLAFTVAVILWYVLPRIVDGGDPVTTFLVAGVAISVISIYLGHGFRPRTTIAVIGTLATLGLSVAAATFAIRWAKLFGLGTEEAFFLQTGGFGDIDLRGLLLGGIIIGVLGVLDDITTAQAATVEEIHRADPTLGYRELVRRGLSVGHEHIASLVNTLVLAYVGASFPLLLLFTRAETPLFVTLNSERVTEELLRTLIGSSALVLAVPITTTLAAWWFSRYGAGPEDDTHRGHAHPH